MTGRVSAPGQAAGRAARPDVPGAAGRRGFKAELEDLRQRMRGLDLGVPVVAREIGRRYRVRPREAYRLACGWTLDQAAARFNARAAQETTDPQGRASMTGCRLCEYEKWPASQRRPSLYVLTVLARMYETGVLALLDLADHENLPPHERLVLLRPAGAGPPGPDLTAADGADRERVSLADRGHALANARGMSLSLPYVPGRLVIEVSGVRPAEPGQPGQAENLSAGRLVLVANGSNGAVNLRPHPARTRWGQ